MMRSRDAMAARPGRRLDQPHTKVRNFYIFWCPTKRQAKQVALIAQLGERQTEDLKVPCSIHGQGINFFACDYMYRLDELPWQQLVTSFLLFGVINYRYM